MYILIEEMPLPFNFEHKPDKQIKQEYHDNILHFRWLAGKYYNSALVLALNEFLHYKPNTGDIVFTHQPLSQHRKWETKCAELIGHTNEIDLFVYAFTTFGIDIKKTGVLFVTMERFERFLCLLKRGV